MPCIDCLIWYYNVKGRIKDGKIVEGGEEICKQD